MQFSQKVNFGQNSIRILDVLFISLLFLALQWHLDITGVLFLNNEWLAQTYDITIYENDLFQSLLYDHNQHPFVNLFLGIIYKITREEYAYYTYKLNCIECILILSILYNILDKLSIVRTLRIIICLLLLANPSFTIFCRMTLYHIPVLLILSISIFTFLLYMESKNSKHLVLFYFSLSHPILEYLDMCKLRFISELCTHTSNSTTQ